ncbi:MAG: esterase [Candidatus Eremiobacteraeota bacterium]|nr:esterase [Candidatus Eremiobacteraeota bacterium]
MAQSELGRLLKLEGDVRIDVVDSPALRDNALGDSSARPLAVYLPPGYDPEGSRRYPVIYVLHGYTGDVAALVSGRPWETNVVQWVDRLITQDAMPAVLLAVVDGFTRLGGSQYLDSVHNGDYATYVVRDVIGHLDAAYRTIPSEGGRAVVGKSSGGFGSMYLCMERAGVFGAFASHSGDANFLQSYVPSFVTAQRTLEAHGNDIAAFVESFEKKPKRQAEEYTTMEMLAYAAAYSPRERAAFSLDLPWNLRTGAVEHEVMARWLEFDPCELCLRRGTELGRLRLRYVDCGRRDEYGLDVGARIFVQRLREMGLSVHHEEFDDDHRNVGYRYAVSLPALAHALER